MAKGTAHKGDGHRKRLREKFLSAGLSGFHDYEVIELLLTLATPRKDCKETAKAALKHFKTLQGVFEASPEDLCTISGLGPNNIIGLRLIKAAADRYLEKKSWIVTRSAIRKSFSIFSSSRFATTPRNVSSRCSWTRKTGSSKSIPSLKAH